MQINRNIDLTFGLDGKVAIVTGAAGDIGKATVALLVAHGVKVIAEDIKPAVSELACTGQVVALVGDVAEEETAKRAIALALEHFGTVDILVNNAGRTMNKAVLEMSVADWDGIMAVNARGTFLHIREALRIMLDRGNGAIVNVSSIVSEVGMPQTAVYAASKGAIAQLTKVVAVEYGNRGIRANAVAPGVVETGILDGMVEDSRATLASYDHLHPIGRVGQASEIARVIVFLASQHASFITGATIMADGGYTAQ
ncbi:MULTISPECIES: SDR family NAD(P)-dependent oxidoreductase [unclassified Janthinobacterium]|uniref:SDR family NAD(P)-dependent oxidoreductase n=1 Tax=unclassified Janthinobacterium TaxID=2610881 RepID=UPI001620B605|nr:MULTISPECIES: SDR family oxidoreductase [unclassified Janthinobacterium]MBB5371311.1 hypothetical protein [Janthinobacterium sp. K2C7]MBB5384117.1 hypothetical protein [Janthinobacterium sp. K2Li3]MBB5389423.1 hypothetical protein [Janthinobacterium sp. K2E3]